MHLLHLFHLLVIRLLIWPLILASADTDPADLHALKDLGRNLVGDPVPSWSGDDPCGAATWRYIQCEGASVVGIHLENAKLSGQLPPSLNQMVNLQVIALQGNNFTGPLPSFRGLSSLRYVYMSFNSFTLIPADFFVGMASSVIEIALDYSPLNASSGGWALEPSAFVHLTNLRTLSLTATHLSGHLPHTLGNLPNLQNLHLAYNYLNGSIPESFASAAFVSLQLNNQQGPSPLSGTVEAVGSMLALSELWLHVNAFSGSIPETLGSLVSLTDCRLNDNDLVGTIPLSFTRSLSLKTLALQNNHLIGAIPSIPSLTSANFTFSGNGLCSDTIGRECSEEVNALVSFLAGIDFPPDLATSWMGNNPCLWTGISCNPKSGAVVTINLPGRRLSGTISPALANLTSLQNLVLDNNNLTGVIPAALASLPSLRRIFIRNNNLAPPLPAFQPGKLVYLSGNPELDSSPSGAESPKTSEGGPENLVPLASNIPATRSMPFVPPDTAGQPAASLTMQGTSSSSSSSDKSSKSSSSAGVITGGVVGAFSIALVVGLLGLFLVKERRKKRHSKVSSPSTMLHSTSGSGNPEDPAEVVKFTVGNRAESVESTTTECVHTSGQDGVQTVEAGNLVISIQVLRNVTRNFSEENVLGRGGFGVVYKGELDDGTKIAVKRMESSVISNKGLKEFRSEIAVLTKVRHRNLVSLLGYCICGYERLLVYEFMPLGNLSQHLFEFKKLGLAPLSLKQRLGIALDVARGTEYLHSLAHQASFIHRDLKPSNILLGDDYRAKVSDFGLVKLVMNEDKNSIETRLAGTFGYLAPEYAVTGRVTTRSDVFSFGVVLMELISGRKALDESRPEESMHLVSWFRRTILVSIPNDDDFRLIIDPALELPTRESLETIRKVAELAGHCTARDPWHRPDMSHAVNVLSPLVERWIKPMSVDMDNDDVMVGIDLDITLLQALEKWQAYQPGVTSVLDTSTGSMPSRPLGFADSFTSIDGR